MIGGGLSLAFRWYRVDFSLRTFHASYLFGGLRPARLVRSAGRIQYEFYGISTFWAGHEEVLLRGLGWLSAVALIGGLALALWWAEGGGSYYYAMSALALLGFAIAAPAAVIMGLSQTVDKAVAVTLTPLPPVGLAAAAGALIMVDILIERSTSASSKRGGHHGDNWTAG
jgi:hypothetical protein